jgi:FMN-dependent NADH-azoreductase
MPATAWPILVTTELGLESILDDGVPLREAEAIAAELQAEFREADALLLAAPMYNYGIPQHIKTWIDLLMVDRELVHGPSPVAGRPAIFVLSRGGGYAPGTPKYGWDHATAYLERIFGDVLGMNIRSSVAELTLAPATPGMEQLIEAAKESESKAHADAQNHGAVVARELIGDAA